MNHESRRTFLKKLGQGVAFIATSSAFMKCTANKAQKPNIVLLIADDCTYWDIGSYGSKDSKTPNIDRLAREGKRFTQCFQAAPMCSPTRHNLYTGLYPVKTGAYPNHTFAIEGTKSIVHYLKPLGYRVALAGKRHIAPESVFPFEYLPGKKNPDFRAVEAFLVESKQNIQPFCLFLCSHEPHRPWDKGNKDQFDPATITMPPFMVDTPETREVYTRYLAEINYLDGQVGKALQLLDKHGLRDNTVFIFLSEQGNSLPFAKWTCYEAGVQSAFIARWPGKIKSGSVSDALLEYSDVVPTFIDVAGGSPPPDLDGKSLLPVLLDKTTFLKKYVYSLQTTRGITNGSDYYGIRSVRSDKFRYIWNLTPDATFKNNVTTKQSDWWDSWKEKAKKDLHAAKMIRKYQKRPKEELYDIKNDPWCMNNLADLPDYQKEKAQLRTVLLKWMENCGDRGQETELEAWEHQPEERRRQK